MARHSKTRSSKLQQMIATALIAALLFPGASTQAQSPAQQPQPQTDKDKQGLYRLRVESELVLVNVVVRDLSLIHI